MSKQTHKSILSQLSDQVQAARLLVDRQASEWWHDPDSHLYPPASDQEIEAAELTLGFALPPLLKAIYREVGNGGQLLGPGLYGLPGGYDAKNHADIVVSSQDMAAHLKWWKQFIVVCDQGCSMCSCVDCTDSDFAVYRWDGNALENSSPADEATEDLWALEANTFEEWIVEELRGFDLRRDTLGERADPQTNTLKRPWWKFW